MDEICHIFDHILTYFYVPHLLEMASRNKHGPEDIIRQRMKWYYHLLNATNLAEKDAYVRPVSGLPDPEKQLRSNEHATQLLFEKPFIKYMCGEINGKEDIQILIGGSTPIAAILKNDLIVPGDIDLYIKDANFTKADFIDKLIRNFYKYFKILLIRNPVTITWIIYDGKTIIQQIQLVIMQMKSWAEIFITNHSDITCVGYDTRSASFVYFHGRWESILKKNHVHHFSNIVNLDTAISLKNAADKYSKRGFNCKVINITSTDVTGQPVDDVDDYYGFSRRQASISGSHRVRRLNHGIVHPVVRYILEKYQGISNICLSDRISDLYNDTEPHMPVMEMADLSPNMMEIPSSIDIPCSCELGREHTKYLIMSINRKNETKKEQLLQLEIEKRTEIAKADATINNKNNNKTWADIAKAQTGKSVIELPKSSAKKSSTTPLKYVDAERPCDCTCPIDMGKHRVFLKNDCGHTISFQSYIANPIRACPTCRAPFYPNMIHIPIDQTAGLVIPKLIE